MAGNSDMVLEQAAIAQMKQRGLPSTRQNLNAMKQALAAQMSSGAQDNFDQALNAGMDDTEIKTWNGPGNVELQLEVPRGSQQQQMSAQPSTNVAQSGTGDGVGAQGAGGVDAAFNEVMASAGDDSNLLDMLMIGVGGLLGAEGVRRLKNAYDNRDRSARTRSVDPMENPEYTDYQRTKDFANKTENDIYKQLDAADSVVGIEDGSDKSQRRLRGPSGDEGVSLEKGSTPLLNGPSGAAVSLEEQMLAPAFKGEEPYTSRYYQTPQLNNILEQSLLDGGVEANKVKQIMAHPEAMEGLLRILRVM